MKTLSKILEDVHVKYSNMAYSDYVLATGLKDCVELLHKIKWSDKDKDYTQQLLKFFSLIDSELQSRLFVYSIYMDEGNVAVRTNEAEIGHHMLSSGIVPAMDSDYQFLQYAAEQSGLDITRAPYEPIITIQNL